MFKRFTALLLSVLLLLPFCAFAEEELDIEDVIDLSEEESTTYQLDSNGNTIITNTIVTDPDPISGGDKGEIVPGHEKYAFKRMVFSGLVDDHAVFCVVV